MLGQTIWFFDENSRVYPRDAEGKPVPGGPIYSAHFRSIEVTGSTRDFWLTNDRHIKIKKADLTYKHWSGGRRGIFPTPEAVEADIYVHENRYKIAERVQHLQVADLALLKQVDQLLTEAGK